MITGGVPAPGAAGLSRELGDGDGVVAQGVRAHGGWPLQEVLADRGADRAVGG